MDNGDSIENLVVCMQCISNKKRETDNFIGYKYVQLLYRYGVYSKYFYSINLNDASEILSTADLFWWRNQLELPQNDTNQSKIVQQIQIFQYWYIP